MLIPFSGIKQYADTISAHLNGQYASTSTQYNISTGVPRISQYLVTRDCLVANMHMVILGPWCGLVTKIHTFELWISHSYHPLLWPRDKHTTLTLASPNSQQQIVFVNILVRMIHSWQLRPQKVDGGVAGQTYPLTTNSVTASAMRTIPSCHSRPQKVDGGGYKLVYLQQFQF